eukprot:2890259-Karenia_brevis.AAC.1
MCDPKLTPTFNANDLKCYRDKCFPFEDCVDDFEMCFVIDVDMGKIFRHLGVTPAPISNEPEKAFLPHMMEMDPSDGKMEDDLYGLLDCSHSDTADTIKKKGRLAQLPYHLDKAKTAMRKR